MNIVLRIVNSAGVDDWTAEWAIIASNETKIVLDSDFKSNVNSDHFLSRFIQNIQIRVSSSRSAFK